MKHYDNEVIEENSVALIYTKWINLRLNKVTTGACMTYITNYASYMQQAAEEGCPIDANVATSIFLSHIDHGAYLQAVLDCKIKKYNLTECMDIIRRVGVIVEKRSARVSRKLPKLNSSTPGGGGGGGNEVEGMKFNGKALDEFGFFVKKKDFSDLSFKEKKDYWKLCNKWRDEGKLKKKPSKNTTSYAEAKKSLVREVITQMIKAIEDLPTTSSTSTPVAATPSASLGSDLKAKMLKINMARLNSYRFNTRKESPSNAVASSGADTCILGKDWLFLHHSDREATVNNLKIGIAVAAYDLPSGETVLVMINEAIDYTVQDYTMLSLNQMRHHGVDVCDAHPKFVSGGRQGLFRIKVKDVELPFRMENALATIRFRPATLDEIENCEVIQLTSETQWDPECLNW